MSTIKSPNLDVRTNVAFICLYLNLFFGPAPLYAQGAELQAALQIQYMPRSLNNGAWPVAADENTQTF